MVELWWQCFLLTALLQAALPAGKRPNILFLMSDSMDGRVVDRTSREAPAVELPFLRDFFTKEGTSFVRTYSNTPQCVPSRSSMCTGRRTDQIESWSNMKGLAAGPDGTLDDQCITIYGQELCSKWGQEQKYNETIFSALAKLNYGVNLFGKIDIGAAVRNNVTVKQTTSEDGWHGGASLAIVARSADIRHPTKSEPLSITDDANDNVHPEDWRTVQRCEDWIAALPEASKNADHFFLYCSVNIPHPSFQTNQTWLDKVSETNIMIPPWRSGFPSSWHPYDSYQSFSKNVTDNYTHQQILKVRKTYYAMCAETDYLLGRVWAKLQTRGYSLEDTYVVFLSDHGEMNMEHRQIWKNSMYEGSSRVPFNIAGPGIAKGRRVESLVSLLDVFPTLLDMAREDQWERHSELAGRTVLPLANVSLASVAPVPLRAVAGEERAVVSQYHSNMGNTGAFMVRKGPWKYITFGHTLSFYPPNEYYVKLYNVDEDPDEMKNVAGGNPEIVKEMAAELSNTLDFEAVDKRAKAEDFAMYRRFFSSLPAAQLRAQFEGTFTGFTDGDWAQVQQWAAEGSRLFQSGTEEIVV